MALKSTKIGFLVYNGTGNPSTESQLLIISGVPGISFTVGAVEDIQDRVDYNYFELF